MVGSSERLTSTTWGTLRGCGNLLEVSQSTHGHATKASRSQLLTPGLFARTRASDKSKHALSPRDTDLIEITLTTLFSVDKLLHLLRHRRRALTLLRHRLQ